MQCGLLGEHLSHSFSPQIHAHLGAYPYKLYEVRPEDLCAFLKDTPFTGINVTIPYKKSVIPFCDKLTPTAALLGAVNTVIRQPNGTLLGHNTDYQGFRSMVEHSGLSVTGKKVLVLGSGGASATVVAVLKELGATPVVISRTGENNYSNLYNHRDAAVIVNTTPVGMYPHNGSSPVELDTFPVLEGVLDLIYNPHKTALLIQAEARKLITENGLWMLIAQAKESAEYFTGTKIDDRIIHSIYSQLMRQTENIVLIGMPGCGKSTVGKLLAEKLQQEFMDADAVIESETGLSIPTIFAQGGEMAFRKVETHVLEKLGKRSGKIIATGGGCVTVPENYNLLHQNGLIIWLKRDIDILPTEGRPLSSKNTLHTLYKAREPLYKQFCDITVDNNGQPEHTVSMILSALSKGDQL